ncbi:ATP-binding cassette domain-containing protein [candidate division CSSED10-310 bacterium]|uniref:ATP-binding cassette domain-containing protein n=1 Tax=candidate division CSSED10-310 bacterium TaxID=2855610 RepID=A0ABV6YT79_UNCC1
MIEIEDLYKSFGTVKAVQGVSFQAQDGRITGLLGPNGAGKTTTLRVLSTVLKPDRGTAKVDGYDVLTQSREVQGRIGVLPHSHGLYSRLTTREHIQYYGRLHQIAEAELKTRIEAIITLLDMHDIADRKTAGFSEGQSVKVAIARALVHSPQNVILDEPTAGLDVMSSRRMREMIRRLREDGRCVLFSSHRMREVSELCDTIVIIAQGVVKASGSPDDLLTATGVDSLESAFIAAIGTEEGIML